MAFSDFLSTGGRPGGTQSSTSTYFAQPGQIPQAAQGFIPSTFNQATGAQGQYQNYLSNPTASPLYQNTLSGILAALQPSEKQAGTNLMDMFRGAGNLSSGAFGTAASNLQRDILRNRQELASKVLAQQFPEMTQALMAPQSLATQLLQAMKLSQGFGAPQLGGAGGRGGAGGGGGFDLMAPFDTGVPGGSSPLNPFGPAYRGGLFNTPGQTGVNYDPAQAAQLQQALNYQNPGSTMFMPSGDYVSGAPTSAGLYDPSQYASLTGGATPGNTFEPWMGSLLTPPTDSASTEY